MELPFLLSYTDSKLDEAYRRYVGGGESQRKLAKALGIPARSLARRCRDDGWEAERQSRKIAAESPVGDILAAVAAPELESAANLAADMAARPLTTVQPAEPKEAKPLPRASIEAEELSTESRATAMDRMLRKQQRLTDRLAAALDRASEELLASIEGKPARAVLAQIHQLTILGDRVLSMQRKAWCVPDKMEIKDTTPAAVKHVDTVRQLKRQEEDKRRAAAPAAATPVASTATVN